MLVEIIQISFFLILSTFGIFFLVSNILNFSERIGVENENINSIYNFNEIIENSEKIFGKKFIIKNNEEEKENYLINIKIFFDRECNFNVNEKSIVLLDSYLKEVPFSLYNKTYCYSNYLKFSEIIFQINSSPYKVSTYYLFFGNFSLNKTYNLNYTINSVDYFIIDFEMPIFLSKRIVNKVGFLNKYVYQIPSLYVNFTSENISFEKILVEIY